MNCKSVIQELSSYLDGEIDESLKHDLETHICACHHCQIVFDTTRKTIELYCDGKLFLLPDDVHRRLHDALRKRWVEKGGCH